jgi:hypothetical protein
LTNAQQVDVFNTHYRADNADLYVQSVIAAPGPTLDAKALVAMREARMHPEWLEADQALTLAVPKLAKRFVSAFPDFRCNFPIYLTATFGILDGAGRIVAGRPSMVVGVDTVSGYESVSQLPVFFSHELFHRYHYQAAGFSDDLSEKDLIWRSLWAEGLATYVSAKLNPAKSLAEVLLQRDLEARSQPLLPKMAVQLAAALDQMDSKIYGKFFQYGDPEAERSGWPSRAGYYVGYLVAQHLARRHSLAELPHLKEPILRREIGEVLEHFATSAPTP